MPNSIKSSQHEKNIYIAKPLLLNFWCKHRNIPVNSFNNIIVIVTGYLPFLLTAEAWTIKASIAPPRIVGPSSS